MNQTDNSLDNGLKHQQLLSKTIKINPITNNSSNQKIQLKITVNDKVIEFLVSTDFNPAIKDGYFVAYLDYSVLIGKFNFNNHEFTLTIAPGLDLLSGHLQKLRLFNEEFEIFLQRNIENLSLNYNGRIRIDKTNSNNFNQENFIKIDAIDCNQILFGTKAKELNNNNDWIILTEERGTEIILPADILNSGKNEINNLGKTQFIAINIRNYVDFHEISQQAYYCDHRLLNFNIITIPRQENKNARS